MSKTITSKQPMSGLRTVKRDFSSSSLPPASQDSVKSDPDTIPWQPTPPKETKKLSGLEQRLKDIQDALKGQVVSSESVLASSSQSQKRPSTSQNPPAKRRQLPPSWEKQETKPAAQSSRPSYPQRATRQTNASANETLIVPASKSGAASKPAAVFLSQEQTHILKLVESGMSLFYTGSAGESCVDRSSALLGLFRWWSCIHVLLERCRAQIIPTIKLAATISAGRIVLQTHSPHILTRSFPRRG